MAFVEAPAVVLLNPKFPHNVGAALRACACWGIENLIWTGSRVLTLGNNRLPREERMKGYKHVNMTIHQSPFNILPKDIVPVCVEIRQGAENLVTFEHPEKAVYLFGPEDGGVDSVYAQHCHKFVMAPTHHCMNLAAAVNVVLYDRRQKRMTKGLEPMYPLEEILKEHRGPNWTPYE